MYFTTVGGSMLLHVLAGHPRLIAMLGIASAVAMLSSPLGPGTHLGTEAYATRLEQTLQGRTSITDAQAETAVESLISTNDPNVPVMIVAVLNGCGSNCSDVSLQNVLRDPSLEREVLMLYVLNEQPRASAGTLVPSPRSR